MKWIHLTKPSFILLLINRNIDTNYTIEWTNQADFGNFIFSPSVQTFCVRMHERHEEKKIRFVVTKSYSGVHHLSMMKTLNEVERRREKKKRIKIARLKDSSKMSSFRSFWSDSTVDTIHMQMFILCLTIFQYA